MGKGYSGDINGIFWSMQPSYDAEQFGAETQTGPIVNYHADDLETCERRLRLLFGQLGREPDFALSGGDVEDMAKRDADQSDGRQQLYASLELGVKLYQCLQKQGYCNFDAEVDHSDVARLLAEQAQQFYDGFFGDSLVRTVAQAEDEQRLKENQSDGNVLEQWRSVESLRNTHVGIAPGTTYFLALDTGDQRARLKVTLDEHGEVADSAAQFRGTGLSWMDVPQQDHALPKRYASIVGFHEWLP